MVAGRKPVVKRTAAGHHQTYWEKEQPSSARTLPHPTPKTPTSTIELNPKNPSEDRSSVWRELPDGRLKDLLLAADDNEIVRSTENQFRHGLCTELAEHIHLLTGAPMVVFTSKRAVDQWSGHVGIRTADGRVLDIKGFVEDADVVQAFPVVNPEPVELQDVAEMRRITWSTHQRSDEDNERAADFFRETAQYVLMKYVEGY